MIMYNKFMGKYSEETKQMLKIESIIIICVISLYITVKMDLIKILPECYFYNKLGLLCPSCGGTRCVIELMNFNFIQAIQMNGFIVITFLYLMILNIVYIYNTIRKKNKFKFLYIKNVHIIIWGVLLIIYTIFRNIIN